MIRYSASVERGFCRLYTTSGIQVESVPAASQDILNAQRLKRPSSPHFTIYQPQITWVASIANRVTGVGLSVGMCLEYWVQGGPTERCLIGALKVSTAF